MHKVACIESCRAVDDASYAIHNKVKGFSDLSLIHITLSQQHQFYFPIFTQDTNECVCAESGDASSLGQKQGDPLCKYNEKYVAWTISSFPASKSCGDLYYQKQVYVDNDLLVSVSCPINQKIYLLLPR